MADRHNDDFERRLADRLRAHADRAVDKVDAPALARHLAEASDEPRLARRWTTGAVALTVVLASLVTVSALQLLPASSSPKPSPSVTPGPSPSETLAAPPIDEAGTFPGGGLWVRRGGDLYLSTDGGASWSRATIDPIPLAVFVRDAQHAWTVSAGPGSTGNTGQPAQDVLKYVVSRTTDGGGDWQSVDLPGSFPETAPALSFVDAQRGYLLIAPERFSNGAATVFATSDGGTSWRQVGTAQSPLLQYGRMFTAFANGKLWAGSEATATGAGNWDLLQVSRDGGASWQPVSLPGRDVLSSGDYLLAPPTVLGSTVIVGVASADKVVFYRSADGGQSWQASSPLAFDLAYGAPAILDATHWLVPAVTGTAIWVTEDGGASWLEQATAGLPGLGPIASLSFADAEHGIARVSLGNSRAPDGLFVTDDGGRNWRPAVLASQTTATPFPSPLPDTYRIDPGSPFTIIDSAEADALFRAVDSCTNPVGRFTVSFPAAWYTNPPSGALPACSWFAATPFSVSDTTVVPHEVQIVIQAFDGAFGYFDSPDVTMSEQILIGGHEGIRWQQIGINHEGDGHESLPPSYIYSANFGGLSQEGTSLQAIAASKGASDYILNKAVLDRIMASLVPDSK